MSLLIEVLCVRKKTRNFYKKILSFFTLKINAIIALLVLFIKLTMCFCVYSANIFTKLILSFSCFIFCFLFWFLPVFNNQYCYYTYNSCFFCLLQAKIRHCISHWFCLAHFLLSYTIKWIKAEIKAGTVETMELKCKNNSRNSSWFKKK